MRPDDDDAPDLSDVIWILATQCWVRNPKERPTAKAVANTITQIFDTSRNTQPKGAIDLPREQLSHPPIPLPIVPTPSAADADSESSPSLLQPQVTTQAALGTRQAREKDYRERHIRSNIIDSWVQTHESIDTSSLYYIKNRASGRVWSYIAYDSSGDAGYVVCDRANQPAEAYFKVRLALHIYFYHPS